jgi:uncharacterized RDD family membrane protein YckC
VTKSSRLTPIVYLLTVPVDDRITITTPEGVDVQLVLAGLGSRFLAGMLDLTIEVALLLALLLVADSIDARGFMIAVLLVVLFLILFGYFVLFEVLNRGRTPGKSAAGLRVVRTDGGPVGFVPSATRNLLRLVDGWDLVTIVLCPIGITSVVATRHDQRLGDLAAGTVVVRERFTPPAPRVPSGPPVDLSRLTWDVSAVTAEDVALVRRFLERRGALLPEARIHLSHQLAGQVGAQVVGSAHGWPPEPFLEAVVALKSSRA